jgi:hypothetical protein
MTTKIPYASPLPGGPDVPAASSGRRTLAVLAAAATAGAAVYVLVNCEVPWVALLGLLSLVPFWLGGFVAGAVLGRHATHGSRLACAALGMCIFTVGLGGVLAAECNNPSALSIVLGAACLSAYVFCPAAGGAVVGASMSHSMLARRPGHEVLQRARARRWRVK